MNSSLIYLGLAILAGATVPLQTSLNTNLNRGLGGPGYAALAVFTVAAATMLTTAVLLKQPVPTLAQAASVQWWSWLGGILGALYVFLLVFLAPRLGIASVTGFVVTGQILAAVLIDHFGLLKFPVHALNPGRLAGVGLLLAGLYLVKRF